MSAGEHVLDAEDVKRMGGQDGVYAFRQSLYQGLGRFADGGAVASPTYAQAAALAARVDSPDTGYGQLGPRALAPMSSHYSTTINNNTTVAPTASLGSGNTFYSYDLSEIARQQQRELKRGLSLTNLKGLIR